MDASGYASVEYVYRNHGYTWDDNVSTYFDLDGFSRRYPSVLTEADHLINIELMKGHKGYITGAIKNHFGTIEGNNSTSMDRSSLHDNRHYNIPKICTSPAIKDKLRLNICEAFYMTYHAEYDPYSPCANTNYFPAGISGYPSPNSIMVSKNPVVMDSLLHDLISQERLTRGETGFVTTFLQNASNMGLGLFESGTPGTNDISYSQIQYQRFDMPLVTKGLVDRELRRYKEGLIDDVQVTSKVARLEKGW